LGPIAVSKLKQGGPTFKLRQKSNCDLFYKEGMKGRRIGLFLKKKKRNSTKHQKGKYEGKRNPPWHAQEGRPKSVSATHNRERN